MKETTEIVTIQITTIDKADPNMIASIEAIRRDVAERMKNIIEDILYPDDINVKYQLFIGDKEVT
jgi:hypothetical protein